MSKVICKIQAIYKYMAWIEKERINAMVYCGRGFI